MNLLRRVVGLRRFASARRVGWGVADQAVSSIENFVLGVFVARSLGAASLGALSIALLTYGIIVNASRGLSTDPLMVRFSGVAEAKWRGAVRDATGVALLVGLVSGAAFVALGLAMQAIWGPSQVAPAFIALGVGLPGLVLQDSWRYAFFAAGRGVHAFANDVVWTVLLFAVLGFTAGRYDSAAGPILAFGLTATAAALLGAAQARIIPRPDHVIAWVRDHRSLGPRFLVENITLGASASARSYALAGTRGLAATGGVRGAEMLVGPVATLLMGVAQVAVPEVARWLKRGRAAFRSICVRLSLVLVVAAVLWGMVVLLVLPFGLGELLLGEVWPSAYALSPAVILAVIFGCASIGPSAGLRALGRADKSMPTQFVASGLKVGLGVLGAVLWGAQGTVWLTALAALVGTAYWWYQLTLAEREHFTSVVGEPEALGGARPGATGDVALEPPSGAVDTGLGATQPGT